MPYAIAEFHTYFRMEFKQIYELADKYEEEGLNLREFLRHAEGLHQRELLFPFFRQSICVVH